MSSFDLLFYAFALAAVSGALAAALTRDLRHASHALLATRASLAALSAVLGATAVGMLQALVAVGDVAAERHGRRRRGSGTLPDHAHDAQQNEKRDQPQAPWRRVRASLPVLALFLLSSRAVLMARWPLLPPAGPAPPVVFRIDLPLASAGFPHALVTALLVFSIGMFACATRRSAAGVRIGVAVMGAAAVLPLVAVGRFVGAAGDARLLALLAVGLSAWTAAVFAHGCAASSPPQRLADNMFTVAATVAVALLVAAW